jgi:hypothetical protein
VARVLIGVGTSTGYPSAMLLIRRRAEQAGLDTAPGNVLGGLVIAGTTREYLVSLATVRELGVLRGTSLRVGRPAGPESAGDLEAGRSTPLCVIIPRLG